MFDWLGDIISGIGSAIGDTIDFIGSGVGDAIWNAMLKWLYEIIYGAIADFFEMMGNMGSEVFDLEWVQATVKLFTLFGWGLFVAGTVVAVFDVAIEYQCGRANIKTTALNILKGFFACSQIAVGSLYMFSVPRGYADGFNQWCKQVIAICLTAFMQTTLLFLGLMTFPNNMLLGLGIMLAANEVPRIAQQFGLDSSVRVNMMSVVHATTTAVNLTRSVAKAAGK